MDVVVVGGGFGAMACAARLAKTGHDVTLLERSGSLGGALAREAADGFAWDAGPTSTVLPAVVRDLFRKSGRPLEREVDLEPLEVVRQHRFEDGSVLTLPGGSRAAQLRAVDRLGEGLGAAWVEHVASYGEEWELLRREWFERVWDADLAPRELTSLLRSRRSLASRLRRSLRDDRLRLVGGHDVVAAGHDLRDVPSWAGLGAYLEQRFGTWRVPGERGGMAALGEAMVDRMATRGVTVHTGTDVLDAVVRHGRAAGVRTASGDLPAGAVVCAVDPRRLPVLAPHVARTTPAMPPSVVHLGLTGVAPDDPVLGDDALPHQVVLHGDPLLVVHRSAAADPGPGRLALSVHARGTLAEDVVVALARRGLDLRDRVVTRIDRSPRDLVERWGGSPYGVRWRGPRTARERLGPRTPVPGLYVAGAHATAGTGLPFTGLTAALVAEVVGPA